MGSLEYFLQCNASCGLRFHRLRIGNVCEGNQVFQGIFSILECVATVRVFFVMSVSPIPFLTVELGD